MDQDQADDDSTGCWSVDPATAPAEDDGGLLGMAGRVAAWGGEGIGGALSGAGAAAGDLWNWIAN